MASSLTSTPELAAPPEPALIAPPVRKERSRFHRSKSPLLAALLLTITAGAWICPRAWHSTLLAEEYVPALEQQFQERPGSAEITSLLGGRLAEAGQFRKASRVLKHDAALGEADPLVWLTWAAVTAASGDAANARDILRLAEARHIQGAKEAAERLANLARTASPAEVAFAILPSGTAALARARASGSFLDGIVEWWDRRHPEGSGYSTRQHWAAARSHNPLALRLWGKALAVNGAFLQSAIVLQSAVELDPGSLDGRLALGQAFMSLKQAAPALEQFRAASKLNPRSLNAAMGEADCIFRMGEGKKAAALYENLVRQHPDSADAWIGLGRVCLSDNPFYSRPVEAFSKARALAPDRTDFLIDYARACRLAYDFPTAEKLLQARLAADPEDADAHLLLAQVLTSQPSRKDQAVVEYRETLRLDPHNFDAEVGLAGLIQSSGPEEAGQLLTDALQQKPSESRVAAMLASILDAGGQHDLAEALRKRAAEINRKMQLIQSLQYQLKAQPGNEGLRQRLQQLYVSVGLAGAPQPPTPASVEPQAGAPPNAAPAPSSRR